MGRNFIEVCKCAGWGDVGYVNRWTMEITNNSRSYSIPLVVGRRIAQIVFFDSDGTLQLHSGEAASYEKTGKYQTSDDLQVLMSAWRPENMLPRMYEDREIEISKQRNAIQAQASRQKQEQTSGGGQGRKQLQLQMGAEY